MDKKELVEITKALDLCMLKPKSNALRVVEATLGKVTEVKKPVSKFITPIQLGEYSKWCNYKAKYGTIKVMILIFFRISQV